MNMIGFTAMEYAIVAHGVQLRDGANVPFVIHPIRVGNMLYNEYGDAHLAAAGYLHDVIEDTDITQEKLRDVFGAWIVARVMDVTKVHGEPWPMPTNIDSNRVKVADTLDNVRDRRNQGHVPSVAKVEVWRMLHDHSKPILTRDGYTERMVEWLDEEIRYFEALPR